MKKRNVIFRAMEETFGEGSQTSPQVGDAMAEQAEGFGGLELQSRGDEFVFGRG